MAKLYLILYKEWFYQILEGKKKIEYRDITPYWTKRLFNENKTPKQFDEIIFTNGYGLHRPRLHMEHLGTRKNKNQYEILLGKIIKTIKYTYAQ